MAGIDLVLFTDPAGFTGILKSVLVANTGGVADTVFFYVQDGAGRRATPLNGASVPAGKTVEWNGWIVFAPGDYVGAYSVAGTSDFWVSGTKLPGVA